MSGKNVAGKASAKNAKRRHPPDLGQRSGAKIFDALGKGIIDSDPLALIRLAGLPGESARIVNSDLTTSLSVDRLIHVTDPEYLADFELLSSRDPDAPLSMWAYSGVGSHKYRLPVESVLVVLRPEADSPTFTGVYTYGRQTFLYYMLRIWEIDAEAFMNGPLLLMALAPLARVKDEDLPGLIQRMQNRAHLESGAEFEREFWTGVEVLLGLRLEESDARRLLEGIFQMLDLSESTTYQAILREGEAKGEARGEARGEVIGKRSLLLRMGSKRLGAPGRSQIARVEALTSVSELDRLADRILDVESWDDLLA